MRTFVARAGRPLPIPSVILGLLFVACDSGAAAHDPVYPEELVGQWVRIHPLNPPAQGSDTLTLRRDGTADGLSTTTDDGNARITRWQIGYELMPGGFCVTISEVLTCQGFSLRSDTLSLANLQHTTFVRAKALHALPDGQDPSTPDTSREALSPAAPAPFQPVSGIVPGSR